MLHQRLTQKMLQKLSPQQIQLMKLLQVPTANLEQRIKEELEINPALEENMTDFDSDKENLSEPEQIRDEEEEPYDNNDDDYTDSLDVEAYTKDDYDYSGDGGEDYKGKEEKKTILDFIKSHIKIKDKPERISIEQYNKELEAAEARIDAGEFYTQEEIENMIK